MSVRTHWFWVLLAALIVAVVIAMLSGAKHEVTVILFFATIVAGVVGALRGKRL